MLAHLWLSEPAPAEYVDLVLCRDVYHCTPSQLDEEDAARVLEHLECLNAEAEWMRLLEWEREQKNG